MILLRVYGSFVYVKLILRVILGKIIYLLFYLLSDMSVGFSKKIVATRSINHVSIFKSFLKIAQHATTHKVTTKDIFINVIRLYKLKHAK